MQKLEPDKERIPLYSRIVGGSSLLALGAVMASHYKTLRTMAGEGLADLYSLPQRLTTEVSTRPVAKYVVSTFEPNTLENKILKGGLQDLGEKRSFRTKLNRAETLERIKEAVLERGKKGLSFFSGDVPVTNRAEAQKAANKLLKKLADKYMEEHKLPDGYDVARDLGFKGYVKRVLQADARAMHNLSDALRFHAVAPGESIEGLFKEAAHGVVFTSRRETFTMPVDPTTGGGISTNPEASRQAYASRIKKTLRRIDSDFGMTGRKGSKAYVSKTADHLADYIVSIQQAARSDIHNPKMLERVKIRLELQPTDDLNRTAIFHVEAPSADHKTKRGDMRINSTNRIVVPLVREERFRTTPIQNIQTMRRGAMGHRLQQKPQSFMELLGVNVQRMFVGVFKNLTQDHTRGRAELEVTKGIQGLMGRLAVPYVGSVRDTYIAKQMVGLDLLPNKGQVNRALAGIDSMLNLVDSIEKNKPFPIVDLEFTSWDMVKGNSPGFQVAIKGHDLRAWQYGYAKVGFAHSGGILRPHILDTRAGIVNPRLLSGNKQAAVGDSVALLARNFAYTSYLESAAAWDSKTKDKLFIKLKSLIMRKGGNVTQKDLLNIVQGITGQGYIGVHHVQAESGVFANIAKQLGDEAPITKASHIADNAYAIDTLAIIRYYDMLRGIPRTGRLTQALAELPKTQFGVSPVEWAQEQFDIHFGPKGRTPDPLVGIFAKLKEAFPHLNVRYEHFASYDVMSTLSLLTHHPDILNELNRHGSIKKTRTHLERERQLWENIRTGKTPLPEIMEGMMKIIAGKGYSQIFTSPTGVTKGVFANETLDMLWGSFRHFLNPIRPKVQATNLIPLADIAAEYAMVNALQLEPKNAKSAVQHMWPLVSTQSFRDAKKTMPGAVEVHTWVADVLTGAEESIIVTKEFADVMHGVYHNAGVVEVEAEKVAGLSISVQEQLKKLARNKRLSIKPVELSATEIASLSNDFATIRDAGGFLESLRAPGVGKTAITAVTEVPNAKGVSSYIIHYAKIQPTTIGSKLVGPKGIITTTTSVGKTMWTPKGWQGPLKVVVQAELKILKRQEIGFSAIDAISRALATPAKRGSRKFATEVAYALAGRDKELVTKIGKMAKHDVSTGRYYLELPERGDVFEAIERRISQNLPGVMRDIDMLAEWVVTADMKSETFSNINKFRHIIKDHLGMQSIKGNNEAIRYSEGRLAQLDMLEKEVRLLKIGSPLNKQPLVFFDPNAPTIRIGGATVINADFKFGALHLKQVGLDSNVPVSTPASMMTLSSPGLDAKPNYSGRVGAQDVNYILQYAEKIRRKHPDMAGMLDSFVAQHRGMAIPDFRVPFELTRPFATGILKQHTIAELTRGTSPNLGYPALIQVINMEKPTITTADGKVIDISDKVKALVDLARHKEIADATTLFRVGNRIFNTEAEAIAHHKLTGYTLPVEPMEGRAMPLELYTRTLFGLPEARVAAEPVVARFHIPEEIIKDSIDLQDYMLEKDLARISKRGGKGQLLKASEEFLVPYVTRGVPHKLPGGEHVAIVTPLENYIANLNLKLTALSILKDEAESKKIPLQPLREYSLRSMNMKVRPEDLTQDIKRLVTNIVVHLNKQVTSGGGTGTSLTSDIHSMHFEASKYVLALNDVHVQQTIPPTSLTVDTVENLIADGHLTRREGNAVIKRMIGIPVRSGVEGMATLINVLKSHMRTGTVKVSVGESADAYTQDLIKNVWNDLKPHMPQDRSRRSIIKNVGEATTVRKILGAVDTSIATARGVMKTPHRGMFEGMVAWELGEQYVKELRKQNRISSKDAILMLSGQKPVPKNAFRQPAGHKSVKISEMVGLIPVKLTIDTSGLLKKGFSLHPFTAPWLGSGDFDGDIWAIFMASWGQNLPDNKAVSPSEFNKMFSKYYKFNIDQLRNYITDSVGSEHGFVQQGDVRMEIGGRLYDVDPTDRQLRYKDAGKVVLPGEDLPHRATKGLKLIVKGVTTEFDDVREYMRQVWANSKELAEDPHLAAKLMASAKIYTPDAGGFEKRFGVHMEALRFMANRANIPQTDFLSHIQISRMARFVSGITQMPIRKTPADTKGFELFSRALRKLKVFGPLTPEEIEAVRTEVPHAFADLSQEAADNFAQDIKQTQALTRKMTRMFPRASKAVSALYHMQMGKSLIANFDGILENFLSPENMAATRVRSLQVAPASFMERYAIPPALGSAAKHMAIGVLALASASLFFPNMTEHMLGGMAGSSTEVFDLPKRRSRAREIAVLNNILSEQRSSNTTELITVDDPVVKDLKEVRRNVSDFIQSTMVPQQVFPITRLPGHLSRETMRDKRSDMSHPFMVDRIRQDFSIYQRTPWSFM